ncbi:MAG TPA: 16S rRNA (uracil(1498)-N(3))-methyltransferase [Chthoniobacterales bacterium]
MHRFFVSPADLANNAFTLSPEESHHCLSVLRHQPGDRVTLFDGRGNEATGILGGVEGKLAQVKIQLRSKTAPLRCRLTLAQAIPKGKNMDLVVQKAVELGAAAIAPILSERTVVSLDGAEIAKKQEKWQALALEACKQCGQNFVPEVLAPQPLKRFFETKAKDDLMLIASLQPDAKPVKTVLADAGKRPASVTVFVGPEGDFTPAELGLAKSSGCQPVTLGPIILRTETAAIYCLSVLGHELY